MDNGTTHPVGRRSVKTFLLHIQIWIYTLYLRRSVNAVQVEAVQVSNGLCNNRSKSKQPGNHFFFAGLCTSQVNPRERGMAERCRAYPVQYTKVPPNRVGHHELVE